MIKIYDKVIITDGPNKGEEGYVVAFNTPKSQARLDAMGLKGPATFVLAEDGRNMFVEAGWIKRKV